jgi:hypothetical protein
MAYLVFLVIYEVEKTVSVVGAWQAAGISDVEVLHGKGIEDIRKANNNVPLLRLPGILSFLQHVEVQQQVLFTIVESDKMVDRLLFVSQNVLGELDGQKTGYLFVVPVVQANGFSQKVGGKIGGPGKV